MVERIGGWLDRIDPGVHRRVKGLRLVTAYGIAAMLGALLYSSYYISRGSFLSYLAAGFGLWASVSEGQATRWLSTRDLVILNAAAVTGALSLIGLAPILMRHGGLGPEWILITGAFLVGYLKRLGILGAGIGSQIYIGQLLGYGTGITRADVGLVALAGLVATVASVVPRLLSGPAEHPTPVSVVDASIGEGQASRELRMGLQAAVAAFVIVLVSSVIHLQQSAWAITASTYVDRRVGIGYCRSRSPTDRWNVDRGPARHRVRADRNAHTAAGVDTRCDGNDNLRHGITRALRHCLCGLCFYADGNAGDQWRNIDMDPGGARLGNTARRLTGSGGRESHLPLPRDARSDDARKQGESVSHPQGFEGG